EALDNLFGALRDKDYRYATTWLKSPKKEYKTFHKYEKLETRASYDNIIPLIRISEMYYIIAESTEDPTEALNAINTVMKNRGLSDYDSSIDLAKVLREEYQKEFWGEGQLFYYYKRNFTQKIYCLSLKSEIEMTKAKYMLPLPKSETDYH
ncbi:MAG: RagB/SusD family nutrient uptake outer membrane protein, partial [Rikenellaceae bacterium]